MRYYKIKGINVWKFLIFFNIVDFSFYVMIVIFNLNDMFEGTIDEVNRDLKFVDFEIFLY